MDGVFGTDFDSDTFIYEALRVPVQYARENGISTLIFLGDIFDNPFPTQAQQRAFINWLAQHNEFAIHIIPGNHDYSSAGVISLEMAEFTVRLSKLDHVMFHLKPTMLRIDGVPFRFFPWPHHSAKKFKLEPEVAAVNIAHIALAGALTDSGRKIDTEHGQTVKADKDFWVIGDLHRYQRARERVIYPGTLYQMDFGEALPKGFCTFEATYNSKKNRIKVVSKYHPVQPPYELINLRIASPAELQQVEPFTGKPPSKLYKLFVRADVALPPNYREQHPNVVIAAGWKNKAEAKQMEEANLLLPPARQMELKEIVFDGLSDFLKKRGLVKAQRAKARHIVQGYITKL